MVDDEHDQGAKGAEPVAGQPLTMRHGIIFEGGHLSHPWVPAPNDIRYIDGDPFMAIRKKDRAFAKVVHLDVTGKAPWDGIKFLGYLKSLRNAAVLNDMARVHADGADARTVEVQQQACMKRPRHELYEGVQKVVQITVPAFDGQPGHMLRVATTPYKAGALEFELNSSTIEYMSNVMQLEPPGPDADRQKRSCRALHRMFSDTPHVFERSSYRSPQDSVTVAVCRFRGSDGKMHQKSKTIKVSEADRVLGRVDEVKRKIARDLEHEFMNSVCADGDGVDASASRTGGDDGDVSRGVDAEISVVTDSMASDSGEAGNTATASP